MSVEEIDRVLAGWEERLLRIDESLLALEAEPTYQMLAPTSQTRAPLEGETKRVVEPALETLRELFEQRGCLTEILERAKAVRASMSNLAFWANDEKEREINGLLYGPSIELAPQAIPLARRTLLEAGSREVRVVPEQLVAAMAAAYERARDAVVSVQRAWESVDGWMTSVAKWLDETRRAVESLGVEAELKPELAAIESELEALRIRIAVDPLGVSTDVGAHFAPRLATVTARAGEVAALRDHVNGELASARTTLVEAQGMNVRAMASVVQLPHEIEGAVASAAPTEPGLVDGLGPWLEKIEAAASAGRWQTAERGLAKWMAVAKENLVNDSTIVGTLEKLLARREELSGRLSARRAQMSALSARGAAPPEGAEDMAREAQSLLSSRPTPLARAKALVERYETLIKR